MNRKVRKAVLDEEHGYTSVSNRALYWKELSDAAYRLYSLTISLVNSKGYCWGSVEYFSEKLGWSPRKTSRTIKELTDKKLIRREKRKGQTSLTYLLPPTHLPVADKKSRKGKQKTALPEMTDPTVIPGRLGMSPTADQYGQICQQGTVTDDRQISSNEETLEDIKNEVNEFLNDKSFKTALPNGSGKSHDFVPENDLATVNETGVDSMKRLFDIQMDDASRDQSAHSRDPVTTDSIDDVADDENNRVQVAKEKLRKGRETARAYLQNTTDTSKKEGGE